MIRITPSKESRVQAGPRIRSLGFRSSGLWGFGPEGCGSMCGGAGGALL